MIDPEVTKTILNIVVTIISLFLTAYVVPWLQQRIDTDKLDKIEEYTAIAVRCAEQIYTPEQWQEKKKYVYTYILDKAKEIGIRMDEKDIDLLVEGIVHEVKKG